MGATKRILIVDDEEPVLFVLEKGLQRLGDWCLFETAMSAYEALDKIRKQSFDLIISDLRMPGMDGLQLFKRVRLLDPHTRLILMTAYGSAEIEATAYKLGACRYIDKPFEIEDLMAEARKALAQPEVSGRDILVLSDEQFDAIAQCLSNLQFEVGAQCILLADVTGQLVAHIGETGGPDLPTLISLIGGSFATSFEMARYLGESQALTLNYHEGARYDVYSSNVNERLFIVLLFDKRQRSSRLGMVWLYTRRTLKQLRTLVNNPNRVAPGQMLDADFGTALSDSMDQLLGADSSPASKSVQGGGARPQAPAGEQGTPQDREQDPRSRNLPPTSGPQADTFGLQQALELGLLDPSWFDEADDGT